MRVQSERAQAFLERHGLSLKDVDGCVGAVAPWETVIFGGSIPEGLANADSDVDILLVGAAPIVADGETLASFQSGGSAIGFRPDLGSLRVQIESVHIGHLEMLAEQMRGVSASFAATEKTRRVYWLSDLDVRTIHRLRTGICLRNPLVAEHWNMRLVSSVLPTYLLATSIAQYTNLLEDALGEARERRWNSAIWALKYAVGFAAGALLASVEQTNPNAKWWVRLLEVHRTEVGSDLADALLTRMTGAIHQAPEPYLAETRQLCDEVIARALSRNPVVAARRQRMAAWAREASVSLPGTRSLPPQASR